ncbi:MAG: hypothetical protein NWR12_04040 [Haliea sp.]|mgnify:CR=1 FL=1|jgi:hypothetical protein|nr:hypothetical protein [Haliea sp.]MDP4789746.1 hypothetical protein [Haliea sp.]MDP4916871.1 hypothetical protein [Haliea sp.]MDP5063705.1 hypothetical protein [Haliea sp.]
MKTLSAMTSSLTLAALLFNPLAANAAPVGDSPWLADAFGSSNVALEGATNLSPLELESSTGRVAPLAFAFMVAGFDVALIGVYWGVYVPMYGGGCTVCNKSKFNWR